jgi:uncharacterized protein (DUF1501 family)
MIKLTAGYERNCEGVSRREFLQIGALTFFGLTLPDVLRMRAAEAAGGRQKACILLFMNGGPSHIDTFDPKPEASTDYRGEFGAIDTNVSGIQLSEHLPLSAQQMDKFAIIRSVTSPEGSHERACHYMLTGYRQLPTLTFPAYGSVYAKEHTTASPLPAYVAIPDTLRSGGPGYLGGAYLPFGAGDTSVKDFRVRDLSLPKDVSDERLAKRRTMLQEVDAQLRARDADGAVKEIDTYYQRAYDMVSSPQAKKAFDLSQEPDTLRDEYGRTRLGQGCLLARRLIESGVQFVTVSGPGWDTHANNFKALKEKQMPELDRAYATLLRDLHDRGMLDDTLVVWMGEFGRTPKVNKNAGRDHYPRCQVVTFAGGGVRGGQVIGKSDETASAPADRPVTPEDLAYTIHHVLGIDTEKSYQTPGGRPIHVAQNGAVVKELFG